ncbi:MAG: hypothetical protein IJU90_05705 [Bacteroidales bacterium]|nr:hypothetical protein [Bacteroidales bacterium]
MNKILQTKVEDKCKDMGLTKEFVAAILEKMGSTVTEDSTDETAIENVANQIAEIARLSQGEATRWVNKHNEKNSPKPPTPPVDPPTPPTPPTHPTPPAPPSNEEPDWFKKYREAQEQRVKSLENKNAELAAERAKQERTASINAAFAKHNIPEQLREFVAVPDTIEANGIDGYVAGMAQKIVALQLPKLRNGIQVQPTAVTKAETDKIAAKMLNGFGKKEEK